MIDYTKVYSPFTDVAVCEDYSSTYEMTVVDFRFEIWVLMKKSVR